MVSKAYWWIFVIGIMIIMALWCCIVTAQIKRVPILEGYEGEGYDMEYYQPIIDNNLFRPLGWKPPDNTPKYELIATMIGKDFKIAYVRNIGTNKIYRVGVGDVIDRISVDSIQGREITLKSGKTLTSPPVKFMNFSTGKRNNKKRTTVKSSTSKGNSTEETTNTTTNRRSTSRRSRQNNRGNTNWQAQAQRFQNASPEERQQMMQSFRRLRNGGRGGRRN